MFISGNRGLFIVISLIFTCSFFLARCNSSDKKEIDSEASYSAFAGSAACSTCHKDIFEKHLQTGHFLSSAPATAELVNGSFENGRNEYHFTGLASVRTEKRSDSLFQVEYVMGKEKQ